jgi:photosystem II stability/assembly factor-like uncharacterized protein
MSFRARALNGVVYFVAIFCVSSISALADDPWRMCSSGSDASLRGISAVSARCCWASGSKATVLRTVDAGQTWTSVSPKDAGAADFRDIHAWDESNAVIMSAGDVDRIYRTDDGGASWQVVFEESNSTAFFDGFAFDSSGTNAWLMGDPLDGRIYLLRTSDSGRSWRRHSADSSPKVDQGIAAFAASGTHLLLRTNGDLLIGLGGASENSSKANSIMAVASVLRTTDGGASWQQNSVPIASNASSGVFSLCEVGASSDRIVAVGGDYQRLDFSDSNIAISGDGGLSWRVPSAGRLSGFRSVVVHVPTIKHPEQLITTGPSGTDRSIDGGESWTRLSGEGFHTMSLAPDGTLWASGANGRISNLSK